MKCNVSVRSCLYLKVFWDVSFTEAHESELHNSPDDVILSGHEVVQTHSGPTTTAEYVILFINGFYSYAFACLGNFQALITNLL